MNKITLNAKKLKPQIKKIIALIEKTSGSKISTPLNDIQSIADLEDICFAYGVNLDDLVVRI